jgi:hypothetical protein
MSVHTGSGTYHFEVSRTSMSPEAYVQGCTSTDVLVPPYTRYTGFQMWLGRRPNLKGSHGIMISAWQPECHLGASVTLTSILHTGRSRV